jgi:hypothetical protein
MESFAATWQHILFVNCPRAGELISGHVLSSWALLPKGDAFGFSIAEPDTQLN